MCLLRKIKYSHYSKSCYFLWSSTLTVVMYSILRNKFMLVYMVCEVKFNQNLSETNVVND